MFELAGYETLDLIGGGGFGEVWLAAQNSTGRNVAVKVAHAPILDETLQIRFEREYKALGRLSGHPNIVDIVTAGMLPDGRAFLVLEFIEGGTLWDRSQNERVEEDALIDIGIELAKALKAAHNAGVLHRDVKPENVLLRDTDEAVLSDFGLAHLTDGATTSPNAVVASVAYAAPEILRGEGASTSTDLYGLGVCLLTAAIRSVPFVELHDKSIQTVIQRVLSDPPKDISKLGYSELFTTLVTDLMAKDSDRRPVTADEVLQRLEELPQLRGDLAFSWSDLLGAPETTVEAANLVTAQIEAIPIDELDGDTMNELWSTPTADEEDTDTTDQPDEDTDQASNTEDLDDLDKLIFELTTSEQIRQGDIEAALSCLPDEEHVIDESLVAVEPENDLEMIDEISPHDQLSAHGPNHAASCLATVPVESFMLASDGATDDSEAPEADAESDTDNDVEPDPALPDSTMEMPAITIGQPGRPIPNPLLASLRVNPGSKHSAVNAGVTEQAPDDTQDAADPPADVEELDGGDRVDTIEDEQDKTSDQDATPFEPATNEPKPNPYKRLLIGFAALTALSILTGLVLKVVLPAESSDSQPTNQPSGQAAPLVLPVSIDDKGFDSGTVEATTPSLGPTSPLFCQNDLDTTGMTTWKGSQFFEPNDVGVVEQLVISFNNDQSADNYVSAIEDSLQCDAWNQTLSGSSYAITAGPADLPATFGDRSANFDVTASSTDGSYIQGKTYVIRSDLNVAIIGIRTETQDAFERLTMVAEQAGTSFSEGTDS